MTVISLQNPVTPERRHRSGSVAIEFALLGPLLVLVLMGMVVYGGWFWLAQSVQTLATESARAALAGLDIDERSQLARAFVAQQAEAGVGLDPDKLTVAVQSDATAIRVQVVLDASDHPLLAMAVLMPAPPDQIVRTAVVRTGGF